ncbi:CDGSH iron-sulfur domain-containing protein [Gammaproteobacteria bacterium]|nr:CDGSH iron-sulfur domain-containing protein [Gammaproteobacteria bacterium]
MKQSNKVDQIKIKSGERIVLCRCFMSEKLPYCDGSHRKLKLDKGPIIVEQKD